ncbi:23S rRNA (pseudouridine(1915)-N(3))-methyltransferase RlmH [Nanoarchaeota archaeon]
MIKIVFVGKTKEAWLKAQISEYVKRLGRFARVEVVEVKDERVVGKDVGKIKDAEGERILGLVSDDYLIALDAAGKAFDSKRFAVQLKKASDQKSKVTFVIGGALGLSDAVLKRCDLRLSLSEMTFTNQMVRLLLVEQVYRAFTILHGMEYHK